MKLSISSFCLLLLTQFSYAQEWVRQNPFPFLSQMRDIDFDGPHGLAVGSDAAIFTTTNGGKTWMQGKSTKPGKILDAALVVPGTLGQIMLAGGDNYLLITKDGGKFWYITHDYIPNLYKVEALPGGGLIALGSDFGLKSSDLGLNWDAFNMPQNGMGVTAGHFTSFMNGWVAYGDINNQQVWVTTDGGKNWSIRDSLIHSLIVSIDMLDDLKGFLASRDFVYKTIDGGYHWEQLHPIAPAGGINDLSVADENNLWTSLNDGNVYFSTDGGALWQEVNPNLINNNKTLGIWANNKGEAWTVGKYISVLHTPDFGVTWTDQIPAEKETMFEPNFSNEFVGMVGGSDGTILRTKNSGAKWEPVKFPRGENFFGLKMIDDKVVIAGSASGKVFLSDDFGDHWSTIGQNLGQITDLQAFSALEIIATTANGKIYKTTDGGIQWNIVYNNPSDQLFAVDFSDHQHGWAVGWNGLILMTNDSGDSWAQQYADGRNHFSDVHLTSATTGWVVSSSLTDTIWHTANAGQTWEASVLPAKTNWNAISFMNPDIGWMTGGSDGFGIVLRTDDGGGTWDTTHVSPDALMGIYAIPGKETVWAVGFGGNIVKYSSCAAPPLITLIRGNLEPCLNDTVNFEVEFTGVDIFDWTFPADWFVLGNSNTSSILFEVGDSSGVVSVRGRDDCGDSTIILSVNVAPVIPPDLIISMENDTLISNITTGFFQWLLNGVIIPGAIDYTFHPTVSGIYQLQHIAFTTGCESFSNEIEVTITGTEQVDKNQLLIYPNPAKDVLYIKYANGKSLQENSKITLFDMNGKVVQSILPGRDQITLQGIPSGVYVLQIQNGQELLLRKIMIE